MVGEEFSRKPYAVAVQEGSPLRDLLNDAILRLLNQRRLETLKERWWTDNPEKQDCGDQNNQSDGISIQNIGSPFFYLLQSLNFCALMIRPQGQFFPFQVLKMLNDSSSHTDFLLHEDDGSYRRDNTKRALRRSFPFY